MKALTARLNAACILPALLGAGLTHAEQIPMHEPLTQFAAKELGGIRAIMRFESATASRHVTEILFLDAPVEGEGGVMPMKIQVLDARGGELTLRDIEGPDCDLVRVALFHAAKDIAAFVAHRVSTPGVSQADPGAMEITTFLLTAGESPGASRILFKAEDDPIHTKPLCHMEEIDAALRLAAKAWRSDAIAP
jgi:hypothetical protein